MKITISGPIGSGTTTLCRRLKRALGFDYIYAGQIFRDMAKEKEMSLEDFSKEAEKNKNFDLETDRKMMSFADRHENAIIEGRLAGWFAFREKKKDYFKIWLTAPFEVRQKRIAQRENESLDKIREKMLLREKSEAKRYKELYNIDIADISIYDLVVDNEDLNIEETLNAVLEALKKIEVKA